MEIESIFRVNGTDFPTMEEAQKYLDENVDLARLTAYLDHLKAAGVQRIPKATSDVITKFMAFEKSAPAVDSVNIPDTQVDSTKDLRAAAVALDKAGDTIDQSKVEPLVDTGGEAPWTDPNEGENPPDEGNGSTALTGDATSTLGGLRDEAVDAGVKPVERKQTTSLFS
jgi:hypothetical protein